MKRRGSGSSARTATTPRRYFARAEGALIEDVDGNKFLDFAGGIGCLNTGHRSRANRSSSPPAA
jgi:4-aminobutyrate aminotransferase-like enzyme